MKTIRIGLLMLTLLFFSGIKMTAQEITKYDFLEVIVIQKSNNSGKIKRIRVEDQQSLKGKKISIKQMEKLGSTSGLLNYMNANNWEFIDRKAITEGNEPVWMSYLFRKQK